MRWQMSLSGSRVSDHNTHPGDKSIDWCTGTCGFSQSLILLERSLSLHLSSSLHLKSAFPSSWLIQNPYFALLRLIKTKTAQTKNDVLSLTSFPSLKHTHMEQTLKPSYTTHTPWIDIYHCHRRGKQLHFQHRLLQYSYPVFIVTEH